jgi:hypothetical protein
MEQNYFRWYRNFHFHYYGCVMDFFFWSGFPCLLPVVDISSFKLISNKVNDMSVGRKLFTEL